MEAGLQFAEEMARTPLFQAIVREKPLDFPDLSRYFREDGNPAAVVVAPPDEGPPGFYLIRQDPDTA